MGGLCAARRGLSATRWVAGVSIVVVMCGGCATREPPGIVVVQPATDVKTGAGEPADQAGHLAKTAQPSGAPDTGATRSGGLASFSARTVCIDIPAESWRSLDRGKGDEVEQCLRTDGAAKGEWMVIRGVVATGGKVDQPSVTIDRLRLGANGALELLESYDFGERVVTTFDPPLSVLPAGLEPGRTVSQSFMMVVHPMAHPDRVRSKGPATQEVTLVGSSVVQTPAGQISAYEVRSALKAKLSAAEVTAETRAYYAPGQGAVAETQTQNARVMGAVVRSSASRALLGAGGEGTAVDLRRWAAVHVEGARVLP